MTGALSRLRPVLSLFAGLDPVIVSTRCANCGVSATQLAKDDKKLLNCSQCRSVRYCSRECQRAHWRAGHKAECKARKQT